MKDFAVDHNLNEAGHPVVYVMDGTGATVIEGTPDEIADLGRRMVEDAVSAAALGGQGGGS